ncbi:MAG TPA: hypothetical protein VFD00_06000 [Thermoclostridium sp.]|nr:hypothetical protein [Thermoclostridium sp.]
MNKIERMSAVMKKWKNHYFESSCYKTEDFKAFARDLKKYINKNLPPSSKLVNWSVGHFYVSGFIQKSEQYVYFSLRDVRGYDWYDNVLIRTAAHDKDYTGGRNNFTNIEFFAQSVQELFKRKERVVI